jgi:hypothetical protein
MSLVEQVTNYLGLDLSNVSILQMNPFVILCRIADEDIDLIKKLFKGNLVKIRSIHNTENSYIIHGYISGDYNLELITFILTKTPEITQYLKKNYTILN